MLIRVDLADPPSDLRAFTHLKDIQLRSKWESEHGVFIAESWNVIDRAREAGYQPQAFLVSEQWAVKGQRHLADFLEGDTPIYVLSEAETEKVTGFRVHRGAMALMSRSPLPDPRALLDLSRRVAVLDGLVDHTNVGAIFRSAAALGIDAVLVTPTCADPLYRRSIRVSMGAVFQVPWTRLERFPDPDLFADFGFATWGMSPAGCLALTPDVVVPERVAVFFGSEGPGLSKTVLAGVDQTVSIPMSHGVDSLNVAQAAAITLWMVGSTHRDSLP